MTLFTCCTCLRKSVIFNNLHENDLFEVFTNLTGIKDVANNGICSNCVMLLEKCRKFKEIALKSNELINSNIGNLAENQQSKDIFNIFTSNLSRSEIVHFSTPDSHGAENLHENASNGNIIVIKICVDEDLKIDKSVQSVKEESDSNKDVKRVLRKRKITTPFKKKSSVAAKKIELIKENLTHEISIKEDDRTEDILPNEFDSNLSIRDFSIDDFSDEDIHIPLSEHKAMKIEKESEEIEKNRNKKEEKKEIDSKPVVKSVKVTRERVDITSFATLKFLTHEEQIDEMKKKMNSSNYINSPFKCDHCYKGFIDRKTFDNHMKRHDPAAGDQVCAVCQARFVKNFRLRAHMRSVHLRKYQCNKCDFVSCSASQALEHNLWHEGHLYKCNICGAAFRKKTTHLSHIRYQHPSGAVCSECGASFVGPLGLAMHMKKTHSKSEEFAGQCPHEEDDGVFCYTCNLHFSSKNAWKRHMVTSAIHSDSINFGNGCKLCGEVFSTKDELLRHNREKHPGSRGRFIRFDCQKCSASFARVETRIAHNNRVHLGIPTPRNNVRTVVCEQCGKKFTSQSTLKYHQRVHTGEKPYKCEDCGMAFSSKERLGIHRRIHTGERPYVCNVCPKGFRSKGAINRHLRVHTGDRPYSCQYCGKSFTQSNSMKAHVKTVHLKMPWPYRPPRTKAKVNRNEKDTDK